MELSLDRLTKQYGRKIAVDCVSATLKPGVYGLLGSNGAGKTTLTKLVNGLLRPRSGDAMCCFGVNLRGGIAGWKRSNFDGGRLPECVGLFTTGFWILSKLYCGGVFNVYCSTERNTEECCKKTCD